MVIKFKYGFEYKNFLYGWNKKELYRLPIIVHKRSYPLKKLNSIKINSHKGYRIVKDKKTIKQLQELTEIINYDYVINGANNKDCPF